jgi:exopolysaccharide biosynthesis polyprenyl glycosylphosphotransferase
VTALDRPLLPDEVYLGEVRRDRIEGPLSEAVPAAGPAPSAGLRRLLIGLDAVAAVAGWGAGLGLTDGVRAPAGSPPVAMGLLVTAALAAITLLFVTGQRLYLSRVCSIRAVEIGRLWRAAAFSAAAALLLPRVAPVDVSLLGALAGGGVTFFALVTARGLYRYWLQAGRREGRFLREMVIVGSNEEAFDLCRLIDDHPELGFRVAGVVGDRDEVLALGYLVPWLGPISRTPTVLEQVGVNGVVIAASALPPSEMNSLIRTLLRRDVHVHLSSGVRGIDHRRLRAQPMAHEPLFYLEPLRLAAWQLAVKRAVDVVLTVVGGLLVAAPVLALAAVLIKLSDRGPVLYRQQRVGRHGRYFTVYKLRTMVPNAEHLYVDLARTHAGRDGPLIKLVDDPRRTRVGRLLERLSIDELPQLWNVLRGEMSLVGPRPAQPAEVAAFDDELKARHEVRPGLTGLWQVEARDNPSFSAYRRFDLFYIENWSVSLDLAILVTTVQRVLLRGVALVVGRKPEMSASVVTAPALD